MSIQASIFSLLMAAMVLAFPIPSSASGSGQSGTHSHTGHAYTTMGHSSYRTSATGSHTATTTPHTNSNNLYRPGITHSATVASEKKVDPHSYTSIHRKAEERKHKEEAKKKPEPVEFKSSNRLISPPKPKQPKVIKPIGPFISK